MRIGLMLLLLAIPGMVQAQTSVAIDTETMAWKWTWTPQGGSPAEVFRTTCLQGERDVQTEHEGTLRQVPLATVIDGAGSWTCSMVAVNEFGVSSVSNALKFRAGSKPEGQLIVTIEAN